MTHLTHLTPILKVMLRDHVIERPHNEVVLVPLGSNMATSVCRKDLHL